MMAHAGRLVPQAVPGRDLGAHQVRSVRVPPRLRQLVQATVQCGQLIENPLEPLARSTEGLRLRLPDIALGAPQALGAASGRGRRRRATRSSRLSSTPALP